MVKKGKVIYTMSCAPAYELFHNAARPEINWDTPDGQWVGIWGRDWGDLIGKEVLKLTNSFEYEVWQPDLRADKIYSHTFPNGLVRKLFPAESKSQIYDMKRTKYVVSQSIIESLLKEAKRNSIILHLNGINLGIGRDVLKSYLNCPIALEFLGNVRLPINSLFKFRKNFLGKIVDIREHFIFKKLFSKVDVICCCNEWSRRNLRKYFRNEIFLIPVGTDFNFWKRRLKKNQARKLLGLDKDKLILLSSSRLNSLKQIDKMISVLEKLDSFDFQYIVTGHGSKEYETYLTNFGENLIKKGKLRIVGFLSEEKLLAYYMAADLFIITSLSEGAPDAAKKALAVEVPVFSTNTGFIAELLLKYAAGVVVSLRDYRAWECALRQIFNGRKVRMIDREIAKSFFHWPNVAQQYITMYKKLYENNYLG